MIAVRNLSIEKIPVSEGMLIEIGTESCWIKFCNVMDYHIDHHQLLHGRKVRIVTPRVSQGHVPDVMKRIITITKLLDIEAIIINDYGVLYSFNKTGIRKNLIYGRLLVRCQEYEFDYNKRFDPDEDKSIINSWLYPSIVYSKKIEYLKNMQFTGVELSPSNSVKELLQRKGGFDLDIHMHYNSYIGAYGRVCVAAKYHKTPIGQCSGLCDQVHNLKLDAIYGKDLNLNQENIAKFENNALIGNVVYFLRTITDFPFELCQDVILDARFNDLEAFSEKDKIG